MKYTLLYVTDIQSSLFISCLGERSRGNYDMNADLEGPELFLKKHSMYAYIHICVGSFVHVRARVCVCAVKFAVCGTLVYCTRNYPHSGS